MAPHLTATPTRRLPSTDRVVRRRLMKQMVERRRRERIDLCMDNIKSLVLTNLQKNPADYEKMEKADILEMTVHYLARLVKGQRPRPQAYSYASLQNQQHQTPTSYHSGYERCVQQTRHFLDNVSVSGGLKARLANHLEASTSPKVSSSELLVRAEAKVSESEQSHTPRDLSKNGAVFEHRDFHMKQEPEELSPVLVQHGSPYWRPW